LAFCLKLPATIILFRIKVPSSAMVAQKIANAIALRNDWYGH